MGCPPLQEIHFKMNLLAWNKILFNTEDALLREWVVIRTESDSSSEEDEIPQFSKGIAKQIDKMEQKLKKCVKTELVGEKKDSKPISSDGEEDEFDYDKWVKEQCVKIQEIEKKI